MTFLLWFLFGYSLLERSIEIIVSRRNQRAMRSRGFVESESPLGMSGMILMHVGWFVSLIIEADFFSAATGTPLRITAATIFVATQGLRGWTLATLGKFWNVSVYTNRGVEGSFVANGPYRFIRHPNYLVVILELLTLPIAGGAPVTAVVFTAVNGLLLWRRIRLEEQGLFAVPGYREVMGHKPRFLPSVKRSVIA